MSTRAAPRLCYVEAALRSRRLERRRENLCATIVTMTQLQWISRISKLLRSDYVHGTFRVMAMVRVRLGLGLTFYFDPNDLLTLTPKLRRTVTLTHQTR